MNLAALLGDFPLPRFVAEHYHALPYCGAGQAGPLLLLGTLDSLIRVLSQPAADVLVCRRNEQWPGALPRSKPETQALLSEGYTILVRHAERHDERLAELAASFARDFAAAVNVHMYCTPAGEYGFGWHYDAEEVFLIQTAGRKEYMLRKNTVNPWPLEETLPTDMRYEREIMPVMRCELAAGDWLYVPSGYWHRARAHETALSLAIGVQPRPAIEVLDVLRPRLLESIFWRQRLPVAGAAAAQTPDELAAAYQAVCQTLASELSRALAEPSLALALLAHLQQPPPIRDEAG